eukprot:scaffold297492_cov52-Prasinocladus_malaysianus.AAC.1
MLVGMHAGPDSSPTVPITSLGPTAYQDMLAIMHAYILAGPPNLIIQAMSQYCTGRATTPRCLAGRPAKPQTCSIVPAGSTHHRRWWECMLGSPA